MKPHKSKSDQEPFSEPLAPLPATADPPPKAASPSNPPKPVPVTATESEIPDIASEESGRMEVQSPPPRRGWKLWQRRPSAREQQLAVLQQGCTEMVGLMRSIRDHLHRENDDRGGRNKTLSPLPLAMETLKTIGENQAQTGTMLGELKTHVARSAENDKLLLGSFDRFNDTLAAANDTFGGMGKSLKTFEKTSQRSLQTMQALGQRVEESDRFMGETFARLRDAEREFTDHISKSSKRSALVTVSLCALLSVTIVVLAVAFNQGAQQLAGLDSPPMRGLMVAAPKSFAEHGSRLTIEEPGRDDGIDEPDREIVQTDGPVVVPDLGPVEGPLDFNQEPLLPSFSFEELPQGGLLSITEPPKR